MEFRFEKFAVYFSRRVRFYSEANRSNRFSLFFDLLQQRVYGRIWRPKICGGGRRTEIAVRRASRVGNHNRADVFGLCFVIRVRSAHLRQLPNRVRFQ